MKRSCLLFLFLPALLLAGGCRQQPAPTPTEQRATPAPITAPAGALAPGTATPPRPPATATVPPAGQATARPGFSRPAGEQPGWLFHGSADRLPAIAFSPDGQWLATGHEDGSARLWELATGAQLETTFSPAVPGASGNEIAALTFSPAGELLAAAKPGSGSVDVWAVGSGQVVASLAGGLGVRDVAFSPDGRLLAAGVARGETAAALGRVVLWETEGWEVAQILANVAPDVAFGTAGTLATAAGVPLAAMGPAIEPGRVVLWDLASEEEAATLEMAGYVAGLDYDAGAGLVAVNVLRSVEAEPGYASETVLVETATGEVVQVLPAPADTAGLPLFVEGVTFDSGARLVAVGYRPEQIGVWEVATGRLLRTLDGPGAALGAPAFSPEGSLLAAASSDGRILLWQRER